MNSFPVNQQSFLQNLMMAPRYRLLRHLILIITLMFISVNQSSVYFEQVHAELGIYIYLISFFYFITYIVTGYLQIYYFFPRYLLRHQYSRFFLWFTGSVFLMAVFQTTIENLIRIGFDLPSRTLSWVLLIEFLSNYMLVCLCFSGVILVLLFRHWMTDNQRISQLEKEHIRSEMEQLKEQVSPLLLFNTLNRTGVIASQDPSGASSMLLKLSQLLRYQLYDCNREQVLLSSEITFLNNYLTLQRLQSQHLIYTLTSEGAINRSLVSPLLFITFVQEMIYCIYEHNTPATLHIHFCVTEESILFSCYSNPRIDPQKEKWARIIQRLDILYPDAYSLQTAEGEIKLQLTQAKNYERKRS